MKSILCCCFLALVLAGCGDAPPSGRMTQQIVTESLDASGHPAASEEAAASQAPQPDSQPADQDGAGYYRAKAEKDALEVDEESLEADYRVGKVDEAAFRTKKAEIESREDALEREKDRLKASAKALLKPDAPEGTMDELLARLRELELQDDALELEEERLEAAYRAGELTREEFVGRQSDLLLREDAVDEQKDLVEDALEAMGWDD